MSATVRRDTACIAKGRVERVPQPNGTVAYFFGNTTIIAYEIHINGSVRLNPVRGDQIACGEWYDLTPDEVSAYCRRLEQRETFKK